MRSLYGPLFGAVAGSRKQANNLGVEVIQPQPIMSLIMITFKKLGQNLELNENTHQLYKKRSCLTTWVIHNAGLKISLYKNMNFIATFFCKLKKCRFGAV